MYIMNQNSSLFRSRYIRPLYVALFISIISELGLFTYFGILHGSEGELLNKFLWTVLFCGLGMGSVFGTAIIIFVLDRMTGWFAVTMTTTIAIILFGVCNLVCFKLDQTFNYFGGATNPQLFLFTGWLLSIIGGLLVGTLLFTDRGNRYLDQIGI